MTALLMSSAVAFVAVIVFGWLVLIAVVVALFHAQRWLDETLDKEINAIAPAPCGHSKGEQREE